MNLRWTFSTLGYPEASLPEAAALAARFGFSGLELRALLGRIDLQRILEDSYGTPAAFAQAVVRLEVPVVALDSSFRLLQGKEEDRRETLALARWADAVDVPYLRVFDGGDYGQARDPEARQQMKKELEWWETMREQQDIRCRLMVETHWALCDSDDILNFATECGGKLHLLWDIVHTWEHSGRSPVEDWPRLRSLVRHIHVKDARRDPAAKHGIHHPLPGDGELPVPALLRALEADGFTGPVSLEWERFWNPEMPSLETALERGRTVGWW